MKVYVASLSDYNAGRLHGEWLDLEEFYGPDDLMEAIQEQILDTSPEPIAEEWAIHDYDECPFNLGEYPGLDTLMQVQEMLNDHDYDTVSALAEYHGANYDAVDYTESDLQSGNYCIYEDWKQAVYNWYDRMEVPVHLEGFIDEDAVRRHLELAEGCTELEDGRVLEKFD